MDLSVATVEPTTKFVVIIGGLIFVILAGIGAGLYFWWRTASKPRYRPLPLMTRNEMEFFGRLTRALPELYVFPQIAMSALITPTAEGAEWRADFNRINQKRIDWGIFSKKGCKLIAIVELDDKTHDKEKDRERDKLTGAAGITTLRFESRAKPLESEIRNAVEKLL